MKLIISRRLARESDPRVLLSFMIIARRVIADFNSPVKTIKLYLRRASFYRSTYGSCSPDGTLVTIYTRPHERYFRIETLLHEVAHSLQIKTTGKTTFYSMYFKRGFKKKFELEADEFADKNLDKYLDLYRSKEKGGVKMTREELMQLTKDELNLALTPYMGGLTKTGLKKAPKSDLVDMLLEYTESAVKPKRKHGQSRSERKAKLITEVVAALEKNGARVKVLLSHGHPTAVRVYGAGVVLPRLDGTYTIYVGDEKARVDSIEAVLLILTHKKEEEQS